jgi:hypothetical protein
MFHLFVPPLQFSQGDSFGLPQDLVGALPAALPHLAAGPIPDTVLGPVNYKKVKRKSDEDQPLQPKPKGKKKKAESDASSSEESGDEDDVVSDDVPDEDSVAPWSSGGDPTKWGANFSLCQVGTFAVVQSSYEDNRQGISVVRVFTMCMHRHYVRQEEHRFS